MNDTVAPGRDPGVARPPGETRGQRTLHALRFKEAALVRNVWSVVPEEGTAFEALLNEEYWAHVGGRLRPGDRIEVQAEDGDFYAELLVRECGRLWARVAVTAYHVFGVDEAGATRDTGHAVKWKGPHHKWSVVRADGAVVRHGFDTKPEAGAWLVDYLKQVA